MRATTLWIVLVCASVGALSIQESEDAIFEGRYCDLTEGGLGICKKKANCAAGDSTQKEKCAGLLVCCPLPGTKSQQKCQQYSRIETNNSCPKGNLQAAKLKEFPHMVSVGYHSVHNNEWICGGTLISERFVLTTAVCATNSKVGPPRRVRLGDLEVTDREMNHVQQLTVEEVIVHTDFKDSFQGNDIALLKLSKDVKFSSSVRPACLYTSMELPASTGVALGWGRSAQRGHILLKVELPFVSDEACDEAYKGRLRGGDLNVASMLCAGDKGKDTCTGDTGGPLQVPKSGPGCMAFIVGITSFGSLKCKDGIPTVNARVSHFVPWIESVVWP